MGGTSSSFTWESAGDGSSYRATNNKIPPFKGHMAYRAAGERECGAPAEGQRAAAKLAVSAGDVDVDAGLAQSDCHVVAEAVAVDVAPLTLHDVGQALGAEPQHYVALVQRRHLHLEPLRQSHANMINHYIA